MGKWGSVELRVRPQDKIEGEGEGFRGWHLTLLSSAKLLLRPHFEIIRFVGGILRSDLHPA